MKDLTVCPSILQEGYDTYSPIARRTLFDGHAVSHIFSEASPYTGTVEANEAVKSVGRISLSGAQPKFSIVVDDDMFKFLEKHGLKVISLEENNNLSNNTIDEVKKLIEEEKIKYIYCANKETNQTVTTLIDEYKIEKITINTMHSIDGGITNTNDNYLTIMTNNINEIKKELYK